MARLPIPETDFRLMSADEQLESLFEHVVDLYGAFPGDNPAEHKSYHEAKIRAAQAEEKFWTELKLDLAKKGAWGIMAIIVGFTMVGGLSYLKAKLIGAP